MPVSQTPQTYFGAVPPPGGPGTVWGTRDHRTVESAYVMATGYGLASQVTTADADTINGTANVGFVIDGAIYQVVNPASLAAVVSGLNAIPAFAAIAVAAAVDADTISLTFLDKLAHTVTSYSPGTPDFINITDTTDASNPTYVLPGMGVCIDTAEPGGGEILTVKLPTTAAEAEKCVGVVGEMINYSPAQLTAQGYNPDLGIPSGVPFALHREDYVRLLTVGTITKDGDAALSFTAGSRGKWYPASAGTGTSQVTRGDVVFNGTDVVGLAVDALPDLTVASDTSDDITATALRNAWNASAQHSAVATASIDLSGAESYIILTFLDTATHTVAAVSPAAADVTGITNTTTAAAAGAAIVDGVRYAKGAPSTLGSAPAEVDLD